MKRQVLRAALLSSLSVALLLTSCVPAWGSGVPAPTVESIPLVEPVPATATPFQPEGYVPPPTATSVTDTPAIPPSATPVPQPSRTPTRTATRGPDSLWVAPTVPLSLRSTLLAQGMPAAVSAAAATIRFDLYDPQASFPNLYATWVYALVAPFPTVADGVTAEVLRQAWSGAQVGPFAGRPLLMDESTLAAFTARWGAPGAGAVRSVPAGQLLATAWAERPAWAIVPFEDLEPRWKVLAIDGQSPIREGFDQASYPLTITFAFQAPNNPHFSLSLPATNRDRSKMTILVMTGVTALVRATAYRMERRGLLYPGEAVRDVLVSADLTHISNEIPFAEGCPFPNPDSTSLVFCSDPRYIALLEDVGTDVVELTGNHFQDHGSAATLMTIDMYEARDWPYYGGGRDLADSMEAALLEHNGNKIAFIGCNPVGPEYAWAAEGRPGAAPCNDYAWMTAEIARLDAQGYLVVATMQYNEYYISTPPSNQVRDFTRLAQAGADIVSGSQAHFPQAFAFDGDSFIHYGLGNLFFDQMNTPVPGTKREFIDRHILYDGRLISTEVLTYMLEDYSRPRPMTEMERLQLLETIFEASGW